MFKKVCLATLLAIPAISMAEGLSYNYVEGKYFFPEGDEDTIGLAGSFAVSPNLFVKADFAYSTLESGGVDVTGTGLSGALGYRHALSSTVDLNAFGGLEYVNLEVDGPGGNASESDTGFIVGGGIRALVVPALELNGALTYSDLIEDVVFSGNALYSFTPAFAVSGGVDYADSEETFNIGLRYNF